MRILLAQINPIIGDLKGNTDKILNSIAIAKKQKANLVLFPELSLTGYPPEDLLLLPDFIASLDHYLDLIRQATEGMIAIVGTPHKTESNKEKNLYNSAAIFDNGSLIGFQNKILLPTYDVFDERRYFEPGDDLHLWNLFGKKIAITICEDLWQHSGLIKYINYTRDPVKEIEQLHPEIVLNLSASPYSVNKRENRMRVCINAATTLQTPLLLCNQVGGNDGIIFDGSSLGVAPDGASLGMAKSFDQDFFMVDLEHPQSFPRVVHDSMEELYHALVLGLRDYFQKSEFSTACIGLSGGIDSALVCCIAAEALGPKNLVALSMPSRFSSKESVTDAAQLVEKLGVAMRKISIESVFNSYLQLLEPLFEGKPFDTTEENMQARIRGMILMAFSNKFGHIVLSTGNKSELAMGYSTLYGDMCGGLAVISDLTKGQVYNLAKWINRKEEIIPWNTIHKPPSAELRENQKDSDSLPDYAIIDNVVQAYLEEHLSPEDIVKRFNYPHSLVVNLIARIHQNEYKRRQSPPGLRVSEKAFSIGRKFPIVQRWVRHLS